MKTFTRIHGVMLLCSAVLGVAVAVPMGCTSSPPRASAMKISTRSQLVGGQRALGDVGDFKLSNGIIHAIVQDVGHSRGFGAFGGSLIDVDLVRGSVHNPSTGTAGNDFFTEMFPAFFLEAIEPEKVEVLADGSDGAAIVRVSGKGGEFLSMTKGVNDVVLGNAPFDYHVDYILEPGKRYLKIVTTVTNPEKTKEAGFPLTIPFGFVTLLGEGQRLFVPGRAGYDMRFPLEESYRDGPSGLEALPGVTAPMIATEGDGVSYALAASPRGASYMSQARAKDPQFYPDAKPDWMLIPVASGSFLGSFWGTPPKSLGPGKSYSYTGYLAVGTGDVASAQKVVYGINDEGGRQPVSVGTVLGRVRETQSAVPVQGTSIIFRTEQGAFVSSAVSLADGSFTAPLPPGTYRVSAVDSVRTPLQVTEPITVTADAMTRVELEVERSATLTVNVRDEGGRPLPSKVSVEAIYEDASGRAPHKFLYDLSIGERMRVTDLDPDQADAADSRRYLERIFFLPNGHGGRSLRPGTYRVFVSRGMEYELASKEISLKPGEEKVLQFSLRHLMPTPGYVGVDLHVHSINSVDSSMPLDQRVASYAAEGVDFLSSTDHNYISDYAPTVQSMGLQDWLKTTVGMELTTLEMGHFNAFPLKLEPGPVTHGAFNWFRRPPGELFAQLRSIGKVPEQTLVQVNHPRDTIMGYFSGFNLGSYSGVALPPTSQFSLDQTPLPDGSPSPYHRSRFSLDFDLLEVFNGKRFELTYHYRIPSNPPPGPEPTVPKCSPGGPKECIPAVGEILEEQVEVADPNAPGGLRIEPQPVYPGALEDYYTLTARGHRFTAVGNSDSHGSAAEAGVPRTYVFVGPTADGSMQALSEDVVMSGLKSRRAIVTNGPFLEVWVNGEPVGSEVVHPEGTAEVRVKVQAVPWVDVSKIIVKRGGKDQIRLPQVLAEIDVPRSEQLLRFDETRTFTQLPDDSFIVVEVLGARSMWPVVTPTEIRSIQITEAVGAIGSAFGLSNKYGRYFPDEVQQAIPFAFTNPIWVTRSKKQQLSPVRTSLPLAENPEPIAPRPMDLRRLFGTLHSDVE